MMLNIEEQSSACPSSTFSHRSSICVPSVFNEIDDSIIILLKVNLIIVDADL